MAERETDRQSFKWPLLPESVVVDVGGYKGRWASEIARRYGSILHIYEPQLWAADAAGIALKGGPGRWTVHQYGLSLPEDVGVQSMGAYGTDGCSLLKDAAYMETYTTTRNTIDSGRFRDAVAELRSLGSIDLLMMNIEGYEYRLLPYLIESGILRRVRFLAVQFHKVFEGEGEYESICAVIAQTHDEREGSIGRPLTTWERRLIVTDPDVD